MKKAEPSSVRFYPVEALLQASDRLVEGAEIGLKNWMSRIESRQDRIEACQQRLLQRLTAIEALLHIDHPRT